jgi:hypothetical protein
MSKIIDADFVLIHVLKRNPSTTLGKLVRIKEKLEEKHPELIVDISKASVYSSIAYYPDIFCWNDRNEIVACQNSSKFYSSPGIEKFNGRLELNTIKSLIENIENE